MAFEAQLFKNHQKINHGRVSFVLALNRAGGGCANTNKNGSALRSNWNEMQSLSLFFSGVLFALCFGFCCWGFRFVLRKYQEYPTRKSSHQNPKKCCDTSERYL